MSGWFVYPETFQLRGPVCDGSGAAIVYCGVDCAEEDRAHEDALFEVTADEGEVCPVCSKVIINVSRKEAS